MRGHTLFERVASFLDTLFSGPEAEIRRREDATLLGIRQRRRQVRLALAEKHSRDAAEKRHLASLTVEADIRRALLEEAHAKERTARRLREGEIGFLDALGIDAPDEGASGHERD